MHRCYRQRNRPLPIVVGDLQKLSYLCGRKGVLGDSIGLLRTGALDWIEADPANLSCLLKWAAQESSELIDRCRCSSTLPDGFKEALNVQFANRVQFSRGARFRPDALGILELFGCSWQRMWERRRVSFLPAISPASP